MASAIRCRWLLDRLPFRNEVQFWIEGNGTSGPNRELETRWKDLWCMMRVADSTSGKPLALDDVQSKPWTFSIKRNRAEIGYSRKFRRTKDGIISSSLQGVQTGDKLVAQRTNREAQESRAGALNEYDQMRVLVLLHPFADSPARQALRKQSQTRCPRCGAWSAADRCPQCGAHRMSAEITVHPEEEEEMQVAR